MCSVTFLAPVLVGLVGIDGDLAGAEEGFSCRQAIPALHWGVVGCSLLRRKSTFWQGNFEFQNAPDKDDCEGLGWQLGLLESPLSREGTRRARRAWTSWGRRLGSSFLLQDH